MDREQAKRAKDTLDKIIGDNIRREREIRDLSRDELAEILDLTTSHMGLIERGERGATGVTLLKLSRVLDKSIDDFFHNAKDKIVVVSEGVNKDNLETKRKKVSSLITYLTDKEFKFIVDVIKGLIRINHAHAVIDESLYSDEDDL